MSGFDLPPMSAFDLARPRLQGEPTGLPARIAEENPGIGAGTGRTPAFGNLLESALGRVQSLQDDVGDKTRQLAMGQPVQLHDLLSAMGKSEAAFNLMLEVRNKLVDAWEKVSRSVV